jgi:hypothetical protein
MAWNSGLWLTLRSNTSAKKAASRWSALVFSGAAAAGAEAHYQNTQANDFQELGDGH